MIDLKSLSKMTLAIESYFADRSSDPIVAAQKLTRLPDNVQEMVFEMCVNYIREVSERKDFYSSSGSMSHYRDIAWQMIHQRKE